ncbi:unnamed protein product [Amoebophrya sp. A25]|nr:unnamed protein product [Amoebophrya sp. A25]|eukprot:GSA25T00013224001.1
MISAARDIEAQFNAKKLPEFSYTTCEEEVQRYLKKMIAKCNAPFVRGCVVPIVEAVAYGCPDLERALATSQQARNGRSRDSGASSSNTLGGMANHSGSGNRNPAATQFVSLWSDFLCDNVDGLPPQDVTRLIAAYGRRALPTDEFVMFMLAKRTQEILHYFSGPQITSIAYSFAFQYLEDDEFMHALSQAVFLGTQERLPQAQEEQASMSSTADRAINMEEKDITGEKTDEMTLTTAGTIHGENTEQRTNNGQGVGDDTSTTTSCSTLEENASSTTGSTTQNDTTTTGTRRWLQLSSVQKVTMLWACSKLRYRDRKMAKAVIGDLMREGRFFHNHNQQVEGQQETESATNSATTGAARSPATATSGSTATTGCAATTGGAASTVLLTDATAGSSSIASGDSSCSTVKATPGAAGGRHTTATTKLPKETVESLTVYKQMAGALGQLDLLHVPLANNPDFIRDLARRIRSGNTSALDEDEWTHSAVILSLYLFPDAGTAKTVVVDHSEWLANAAIKGDDYEQEHTTVSHRDQQDEVDDTSSTKTAVYRSHHEEARAPFWMLLASALHVVSVNRHWWEARRSSLASRRMRLVTSCVFAGMLGPLRYFPLPILRQLDAAVTHLACLPQGGRETNSSGFHLEVAAVLDQLRVRYGLEKPTGSAPFVLDLLISQNQNFFVELAMTETEREAILARQRELEQRRLEFVFGIAPGGNADVEPEDQAATEFSHAAC